VVLREVLIFEYPCPDTVDRYTLEPETWDPVPSQERVTEWLGALVAPVPVSGTVRVPFCALLVIVRVPETEPAAVGEKLTVSCVDCPDARENGVLTALSVNPVPETRIEETVAEVEPVLEMVTF
jgi:hypothetical protein